MFSKGNHVITNEYLALYFEYLLVLPLGLLLQLLQPPLTLLTGLVRLVQLDLK